MMTDAPVLWVVMGVSGSGKSTLALELAQTFGLAHADGDDFHAKQSVEKMRAGMALDDEDRWPWLDRIANYLRSTDARGRVVACSALKRAHRDRIRNAAPGAHFLFLNGDASLIRHRLSARQNHFMHPELLQSQLDTLELPGSDERDVMELNLGQSIAELVATVAANFPAVSNRAVNE